MELDILKHFINHEVEVLVDGVWIEGFMMPIAKGVVVLTPIGEAQAFYGPASMKSDVIQAVRQVKRKGANVPVPNFNDQKPPAIRSSLEPITPGTRFVKK